MTPPTTKPPLPSSPPTELLPTPTLDAERSNLLQRISEEGGFAYVNVAARAVGGDFRAAEAAREMAWEQLHSGPWHSVLPVWRDAYSMACLHVAALHHSAGQFREALKVLDMGLIMGGMLLRRDLDSSIERIMLRSTAEKGLDGEGREKEKGRLSGSETECDPHCVDQAKVLQVLPNRSLSSKIVERRSSLSLESFLRDYFLSGHPVIISDCMSHWPARTKWKDMEYLKKVAGDRTVPVEVGKNYLSSEWKQELITFSEFLERIQFAEGCSEVPTYLAQHQLFDQIQELRNDIFVPDYCFTGGGELQSLNAWFGPAGTVTPLHHDPHHNLFAQVDLDNLDVKEFPMARDLDFIDCIIEEGEMLYIPPKWWHFVRSLTKSFSVSFWWGEGSKSVS